MDLDLGATIKGFAPGQKVFSRYTLARVLGRGGMGVVWLARDEELERDVALKFLPEIVALDRDAVAELKRETRRNLALTHASIVRVYDFVQDARAAAISMEYVDGASLSALKPEQPDSAFPLEKLGPIVEQLCAALEYAHGAAKIVHRDLKPANLMLSAGGALKITDFGIARSVADSVSRVSAQAGGSSGTPVYMSPQQMMGEDPAVTDDIYAVGATIFELLTGKPPFHTGNIVLQVQSKEAPRVNERRRALNLAPAVPSAWEDTIAACLAKDPAARPQSARELWQRLQGAPSAPVKVAAPGAPASRGAAEQPAASRRGLALAVGAVACLLAGLGGFLAFRDGSGTTGSSGVATAEAPNPGPRLPAELVAAPIDAAVGQLLLGRNLIARDFEADAAPAGLLSERAWREDHRQDPGVIGQRIEVPNIGGTLIVGVYRPGSAQKSVPDLLVARRAAPPVASAKESSPAPEVKPAAPPTGGASAPARTDPSAVSAGVAVRLDPAARSMFLVPWVIHASPRLPVAGNLVELPDDGSLRIAAVDLARIYDGDARVAAEREKFEAAQAAAQKRLEELAAEGNRMVEEYRGYEEQAKNALLTADARRRATDEAQALLTRIQRKQEELNALRQTEQQKLADALEDGRRRLLGAVLAEVRAWPGVASVDLVVDFSGTASSNGAPPVLVVESALDCTDARNFARAATKSKIGYVDLTKLFDAHPKSAEMRARLAGSSAEAERESARLRDNLEASRRSGATTEQIQRLEAELRSFVEASRRSVEQRSATFRAVLMEELAAEVREVAAAAGYSLVFVVGDAEFGWLAQPGRPEHDLTAATQARFTASP